jgi:hypothetical protein
MKLPRRKFLHLAASAAAVPAISSIAEAQTYPTRPVRVITGFPPGGPSDILARLMGQRFPTAFSRLNRNGSTIDSRLVTSQVKPPKLREGPDRGEPRTGYQEALRQLRR